MKKPDQEFTVGPLLRQVLRKHPAFSASPLGDWADLVGEQGARYSQPRSLRDRVLTVTVYDSVWKHHLELLKDALLEKINAKHPEPLVDKIVLKVGDVPETAPVLNPQWKQLEKVASRGRKARPSGRKKLPSRALTPEEKKLLHSLPDPELQAIGRRLLKKLPLDAEPPAEATAPQEEEPLNGSH
ncbi:DUF721 domain-containing protein [Desulforhabdus sp. TSK]|uniref:DUF721 domain-containing protein n=1 Tax=Desulforhabdus sp. TSK TaxID=2925014 RepID=UPI001FC85A19|nr:DUF721 domain-containing protein [Desulforhabdus sp. TSK]GKT08131.1 hypothetical protein DSTSK_14360 [Desulforhabdus sp. TSK]